MTYAPGSRPVYSPPIVFPRTQSTSSRFVHLESSAPMRSWLQDIAAALSLVVFCAAVWVALPLFTGGH